MFIEAQFRQVFVNNALNLKGKQIVSLLPASSLYVIWVSCYVKVM